MLTNFFFKQKALVHAEHMYVLNIEHRIIYIRLRFQIIVVYDIRNEKKLNIIKTLIIA